MSTVSPDDLRRINDLRQHWRASLAALHADGEHGKGKRRAWYLVIGPSGAGKSTLLSNTGLRVCPICDNTPEVMPTTESITVWRNDHAVFVEVTGRYFSEVSARAEWQALLHLIHRERGHLPLQGVIITKPLAEQFRNGPAATATEANQMRERVQDVAEITGSVVPAYVIVTKADLLGGFKEFFAATERNERGNVLGMTMPWPATSDPLQGVIAEYERLLTSLSDRRLAALSAAPNEAAQRKLMQFPAQMRAALPYLTDYLAIAMRPMPGNLPGFRGLYFTCTLPAAKPAAPTMTAPVDPAVPPKSLFIAATPAVAKPSASASGRTPSDEATNALFIRDVFARIILADASLAAATPAALKRWHGVRVACLVAAPIAAVLFAAWTGWSTWQGARYVDDLRQPYAVLVEHERAVPADATTQLLALDQLGAALAHAIQAHGKQLDQAGVAAANRYVRSLRPLLLDGCVTAVHADLAALRERTSTPATTQDDPYALFCAYQMLGGMLEPQPTVMVSALTAGRRWFRAFESSGGAASEYRIEALARRQLDLCAHVLIPAGLLRIDIDRTLVDTLTREFGDRVWLQQAYDDLIRELTPKFAVVLPETLLAEPARNPLTASGSVSLIYSQAAWDSTVARAIDVKAKALDETLAKLRMPHDREAIVRRLRERFVDDHHQRWLAFITSVRAAQVRDFRDTPAQIERISGPDSPYPRFITQALDHLALTITGTATIRSPDAAWITPCLKAIAGLRQDTVAAQQIPDGKRSAEIARLRSLAARFNAVSAHIGDQLAAIQPLQNRIAIQQGFDSILRSLFAELDLRLASDLDRRWSDDIYQAFTSTFAKRFPFAKDSADDVPMAEFEAFFNPVTGPLWTALGQLDELRAISVLGRPVITLSDDSERMLRAAQDIRALFFAGSSESLRLRFPYRLQQREHVRDLRLQFGAKTNTLYERPDARYVAELNRGDPYSAKISLQTAAGQWRSSDDTRGDWGFLRLLRAGNPKANTNGDLLCTWEFDASAVDKAATVKASLVLEASGMDKAVAGDLLSGFVLPQRLLLAQPER